MRSRFILSTVAVAGLVLAATTTTGAVSQATTSDDVSYADYLDDANTLYDPDSGQYIIVETVGSAQCGKTLPEREGAWMCLENATYGTDPVDPTWVSSDELMGEQENLSQAAVASTATCVLGGCWTRESSVRTTFKGSGWYGYGGTTLGNAEIHFRVALSGFATKSTNVWFRSTRGVRDMVFAGDRLYLSAKYPGGAPVNNGAAYRYYPFGKVAANTTATWLGGYGSYENTVQYATIVHNYSWKDPSSQYPGRWYFYAKSIRMVKGSNGYTYPDLTRPASPRGAGWKTS
jgi:hypothetical protein